MKKEDYFKSSMIKPIVAHIANVMDTTTGINNNINKNNDIITP